MRFSPVVSHHVVGHGLEMQAEVKSPNPCWTLDIKMSLHQDSGPALPRSSAFLASILTSLSTLPLEVGPPAAVSHAIALPQISKSYLLTLHALLPGTLLPALDLLDRSLVTRLTAPGGLTIYYARSAPSGLADRSSRHKSDVESPLYEVRPTAWNCECPAFAFAAYDGLIDAEVDVVRPRSNCNMDWTYGGLASSDPKTEDGEEELPICKHLLACVLAEKWPAILGQQVKDIEVTRDELAAWAAGWGR